MIGDKKLKDCKTGFGVTLVRDGKLVLVVNKPISDNKGYIIYDPEFSVVDAILASSAAPIAFAPSNGDIDGGVKYKIIILNI